MRIKLIIINIFLVTIFACCKKSIPSSYGNGSGTPVTPLPVTTLINLPSGWKYSSSLSVGFPSSAQVFVFDSIYAGRKTKAYCLAYDSKAGNIEFKPVMVSTGKKPSEFYSQESGRVYGCINGGFFGANQSYALVKYNNVVSAPNIKSVNRLYNGVNVPYYPTRVAFGVSSNGNPSTAWIYSIGSGNKDIYQYPLPSPNEEGKDPQPQPTELFPEGGIPWNVVSAIGGSPMLLKNSTVTVSDTAELIKIDNAFSRARSAIGYTASGIVLIMAIEGNNTSEGYAGLNLKELAEFMKYIGCTNAINLDGGGSTSFVISNQLTVKPSDGLERPVVSAVLIKGK